MKLIMNSLPEHEEPTLAAIETYIHVLYENIGKGYENMQPNEKLERKDIDLLEKETGYEIYILTADNHYFV